MARTTSESVENVLNEDYSSSISLTPFIDTASSVVDNLSTTASSNGTSLSSTVLELIERWLAAHFYVMSDQNYREKQTGNAKGVFQGETGKGLEASKYGQTAMILDYSGYLRVLIGPKVGITWIGKNKSEQVPYNTRN